MAAPFGWFIAGKAPKDYEVALDPKNSHCGTRSAVIRSCVDKPKDFGTLMQEFAADEHRGKRLRMSAWVKTSSVDGSCNLWMRVDDSVNRILTIDTMETRVIRGTSDWAQHQIVLDVPENAYVIRFGISLDGAGAAWVDDFAFEVVGREVPTTNRELPPRPRNLDFEK